MIDPSDTMIIGGAFQNALTIDRDNRPSHSCLLSEYPVLAPANNARVRYDDSKPIIETSRLMPRSHKGTLR